MKKVLAIVLTLVMAVGICACAGNGGGQTGASDNFDKYAEQYGTVDGLYRDIVFASRMDIEHLQPTAGTGTPKNEFYWNIFETLFDFDADNNLIPDLAKDLEKSDDGLSWDIKLFETIKDSKGNEINAEDVKASFDWLYNSGEAIGFEAVKDWEVVDDYTFRINWVSEPSKTGDYEFPLCRTYIFDSQYKGDDFAKEPVGTGNYIVVDFVTGNHLTIWANKDYWAANTDEDVSNRLNLHNATVQMITWEIIQESATAEVALEKGTIDYCDYINQKSSIEKFEKDYADKYNVEVVTSREYTFTTLNLDESSFFMSDPDLRNAIFYALDSDAIAQVMGASYLPMATLGHEGFDDFNAEWEKDETYCGKADKDKAKEFLDKSKYDGQTLKIMCKSSEIDKNAAQQIMAQLIDLGVACEIASVDPTIFQTSSSDPSQWDILVFTGMGGTTLVGTYNLPLGYQKNPDGSEKLPINFVRDDKLQELLDAASADATHDDEHMKALIDYTLEQGYLYPVAYSSTCYIYSKEIKELYRRETVSTPAASTYEGQETKEENVTPVGKGTFDPSLAGTYTYSEKGNFGDKDNDFTLTLNEDGTYRLDCNNSVGEEIWTEGTWTVSSKGDVELSASKVQGAMDRLLNAGWADADNPAPVFTVDKANGTMKPANWEAPAEEETTAGAGGDEVVPGIVNALSSNPDFELFTYVEKGTPAGDVTWYVMKNANEGMTIIACHNPMLGTADGDAVWHFTKTTEDKGVLTLEGLEDGDKSLPTMGAQWTDTANYVQQWQITGKGAIKPVNAEDTEEPASEALEEGTPVIVGMLSGNPDFEAFTYVESGTPAGDITWYLLKNDKEGMVIVACHNPMLGTSDGDAVWHFKKVTEDKGLLTLDGLEDGDKSLPQLGNWWSDKDNFIQKWQITGKGQVEPAADK